MSVPSRILIEGKWYPISLGGYFIFDGSFRFKEGRIEIDDKGPGRKNLDRMHETLLHEIFHVCEWCLVEQGILPKESSEHYVEQMSAALYRALRKADLYTPHCNGRWQLEMDFDAQAEED